MWPSSYTSATFRQGFEDWQDPRSTGGTSGLAITSDWLTRPLELKSDARYVVVVEKDGVFNRLVEDRFYDRCDKKMKSELLSVLADASC